MTDPHDARARTSAAQRARRRRLRWWVGGGTAVVLVVCGSVGAYAASTSAAGAPDYRTATVGAGPVTQTLVLSGTVQRVNQQTVSFPASGTVSTVSVSVGQEVSAGQTLATIDPTALQADLLATQATLARDQASLAADQSSGTASPASTTSTTSPARTATPDTPGRASGGTAAITAALQRADQSLQQVQSDLQQENTLCAPIIGSQGASGQTGTGGGTGKPTTAALDSATGPSGSPTAAASPSSTPSVSPTPSPSPSHSGSPTPTPSPSASSGTGSGTGTGTGPGTAPTPSAAAVSACMRALSATASALQTTDHVISAIAQSLASSVASSGTGGSSAARGFGSSSGAASIGGSGTGGSSANSASKVDADQVAILQDQNAIAQAQTDLSAATLTAPISGTVARVDFVAGQTASTSQGIVIIGPGAATVTVDVPLAEMSAVHSGQAAEVTPAGAQQALAATVQSVELLPASNGSTSPAYPAAVTVADPTPALASGASATVSVTIALTAHALRVPASALSGRTGDSGTVTVLAGGVATPTRITLGAIGGGWVQVKSGLTVGDTVVLADAAEALPSNTTLGGISGFTRGAGTFRSGTGAGTGTAGRGAGTGG